jgi:D-alanine-D-alanine ligase
MVTLLHLTGSADSELLSEVSVLYAADCLDNAGDAYDQVIAHVSPDGCWRFPEALTPEAIDAAPRMRLHDALDHLAGAEVDVALPQMFCRPGMTTYRSLLDLVGVPYIGNTPETMAMGADKAWARAVVAGAGVAVPDAELLLRGELPSIAPPVVVKPADADNSSGVTLVRDRADHPAALEVAFAHSDRVLVERYVELGREVRCGVLETDDGLVCLPLEEYAVDPTTKPIRDQADKLARGAGGELALVAKTAEHAWVVPTPDPLDAVTAAVFDAARTAHRALRCRDHSLFDFRIDPDGRPWFLEASLYCSFASTSVVSTMAAAAGIPLADLLRSAVDRALARGARR